MVSFNQNLPLKKHRRQKKGLSAPLAQTEKVGTLVFLTWLLYLK